MSHVKAGRLEFGRFAPSKHEERIRKVQNVDRALLLLLLLFFFFFLFFCLPFCAIPVRWSSCVRSYLNVMIYLYTSV